MPDGGRDALGALGKPLPARGEGAAPTRKPRFPSENSLCPLARIQRPYSPRPPAGAGTLLAATGFSQAARASRLALISRASSSRWR